MSPVVQRQRTKRPNPNSDDQHWSMLVFESLSAGAMALLVGITLVMTVVSLYVILVWPLTFWDLTNLGLEKYSGLANTALWSVFAGGTLAGLWCFSGAAFKGKAKSRAAAATARGGKPSRI